MGARLEIEERGGVAFVRMARTLLGRPLYWTGAYLVDGLLLDCGPPVLARELSRLLAGREISDLVLTHHHEDHSGGAALLARERGLAPRIHPVGVPILARGFGVEPYRQLAWGGGPEAIAPQPLGAEVVTRAHRFQVIHTPGHSPDHVCLYEPERGWLFTGDLFLAERLRYLRADEDVRGLIESLTAVASLPLREVFCAHRGPLRAGPAALARKAANLEALRERILDLHRLGLEEREIARRAVGPEGAMTWLTLGHFSARNFVRSVLC